jgi:hypothetical protein
MVQSVSSSNLLAVFPGSAAARNLAQQNLVLPSPLNSPEQQAQQRASPIVRFSAPTLSDSTLSSLQDSAFRAQTAPVERGEDAASSVDNASRAAQAYANAAQSLRPLVALGTAPPSTPNLLSLAPGASEPEGKTTRRDSERPEARERQGGEPASEAIAKELRRDNPLLPPARQNFAAAPVAAPVASVPLASAASTGANLASSLGSSLGVRVDVGV